MQTFGVSEIHSQAIGQIGALGIRVTCSKFHSVRLHSQTKAQLIVKMWAS